MKTVDQATLLQWLDLDLENQLPASDRAELDRALAADPGLVAERRSLGRLHGLLALPAVPVRDGFCAQVMQGLPVAAWESRRAKSSAAWHLPVAAMLVFALGAVWLLAGSLDTPLVGTGIAVADFLQVTLLAGAGLLGASWQGLGFGLEQMFQGSPSMLAAMAGVVVGLDLLFVSLLRRRIRRTVPVTHEAGDGSRG